jgi:hypothetical protein
MKRDENFVVDRREKGKIAIYVIIDSHWSKLNPFYTKKSKSKIFGTSTRYTHPVYIMHGTECG